MLKIKFPVILNSNFQVQDQEGSILMDLWRVKATPPELKEWGEWLCALINPVKPLLEASDSCMSGGVMTAELEAPTFPVVPTADVPIKKRGGNPNFVKGKTNPYADKAKRAKEETKD